MGYKAGNSVGKEYLIFLAMAMVAYVAASSFWLSNLITRVGEIEHTLEHKQKPGRHH